MARIKFRDVKLSRANKHRLDQVNGIIREYQKQGYVLTLRQLYYQLVSRDIIPNKQSEYSKLSNLLKEGRMGGIVDWSAIEDRLRVPYTPASFSSPKEILEAAMNQYQLPRMAGQSNYLEVWVEKDALSGVLKRVTSRFHVPILVNRGYSSASSMFDSYERFKEAILEKRNCYILYLGDFDPSGVDMVRDVKDRTLEFLLNDPELLSLADKETDNQSIDYGLRDKYEDEEILCLIVEDEDVWEGPFFDIRRAWIYDLFHVVPIALTREQISKHKPPPNPAKRTDPRAKDFIKEHGTTSWEVDALKPEILNSILTNAIIERIDAKVYQDVVGREQIDVSKLRDTIEENFPG